MIFVWYNELLPHNVTVSMSLNVFALCPLSLKMLSIKYAFNWMTPGFILGERLSLTNQVHHSYVPTTLGCFCTLWAFGGHFFLFYNLLYSFKKENKLIFFILHTNLCSHSLPISHSLHLPHPPHPPSTSQRG